MGEEESAGLGQLREEALRIHRAIFHREAESAVVRHYVDAHLAGLGRASDAEAAWLRAALDRGLDLAALEFALRRRDPVHALVRKFQIMFYVAEGSPGYSGEFVNDRWRRMAGFVELGAAVMRSAWMWAKGQYMLRRYRDQ